ncbi:TPA: hypothetical protein ACH3X2_005012 [Trebouxia sp. C0005]
MKCFQADPAVADFLSTPVKTYLALCIDGMNPFGSGTSSVTPMLLMFLNLPAHMRGKAECIAMYGIIPGPLKPQELQTYLLVLVEELSEASIMEIVQLNFALLMLESQLQHHGASAGEIQEFIRGFVPEFGAAPSQRSIKPEGRENLTSEEQKAVTMTLLPELPDTALAHLQMLFQNSQQHEASTPAALEDWKPSSDSLYYTAMTPHQRQCVSPMVSSCQCYKGAVVRGIHIRRIREYQSLRTQDSAIAASFYVDAAPGHEPPLKSFYGIIQEIISVKVPLSDPQFFLKVKWYIESIMADTPAVENVPLVKGTGSSSDFEAVNVDASKETVLIRAERIDQQVFFVDCPAWSTTPANQPWRWVGKEVTSSLVLAAHLLDDEGQFYTHTVLGWTTATCMQSVAVSQHSQTATCPSNRLGSMSELLSVNDHVREGCMQLGCSKLVTLVE